FEAASSPSESESTGLRFLCCRSPSNRFTLVTNFRTEPPRTFLVTPSLFSKDVTLFMHMSSLIDKAVSAAESLAPPAAVVAGVYGASH
nr:hypothetical protein [Tanacetum cinerariifolium]